MKCSCEEEIGITIQLVTCSLLTTFLSSRTYTWIQRFAHDNHIGVYVRNGASASAATIHEVTSKRNPGFGMIFHGPDITVKDSTASYNGIAGIWTGFGASSEFEYDGDYLTKLQFEGKVSSHHNILHGVLFSIMYILTPPGNLAEVNVLEEINTYLNGGSGLVISSISLPTYIISFRVEEGGLVRSCHARKYSVAASVCLCSQSWVRCRPRKGKPCGGGKMVWQPLSVSLS